jgi:hypothetical protein
MRKLFFASVFLLLVGHCAAEIIIVDNEWPYDFNNIHDAISYSSNGDYIFVFPGTYTGPGNYDIDFLGKAITVRSIDPTDSYIVAHTIIDCNHAGGGFNFISDEGADAVLAGFTITNSFNGNAIYCKYSSPTIANCSVAGNYGYYGGGIYCGNHSSPTIANCIITANSGSYGGGVTPADWPEWMQNFQDY